MTCLSLFYHCSTMSDGKLTSLDQYISRMKKGQKDIFYITGSSKEQLEKSPFLERLKKKNYEVGLCTICFHWLLLELSNTRIFIERVTKPLDLYS